MNIFEFVLFLPTILCIVIFYSHDLYGSSDCMVYVLSLYIHFIQENQTYPFYQEKLCITCKGTLFNYSCQYLLNTCLHSNKLMIGYIIERFSFCDSSLHWAYHPTVFYLILLQKWLLGKN